MFKHFRSLKLLLFAAFVVLGLASCDSQPTSCINKDWKFIKVEDETVSDKIYSTVDFDDQAWENVSLPHTANMEPLRVNDQWQGICWYRKDMYVADYSADNKYFIEFEAIMNKVDIWINGEHAKFYQGGYLPVIIDATKFLKSGNNVIALRLDNKDNAVTGPKPLKILDFNMYGGIYRPAHFTVKGKTYITNPILAEKVASGGVFITTPKVSEKASTVKIKTHVASEDCCAKELTFVHEVFFKGELVKKVVSKPLTVPANGDVESVESFVIENAKLWSPDAPNLYSVNTSVMEGETLVDSQENRFGIREIRFKDNQLYINGVKSYLRGVNRHQEYPYVGYALSDNAQYRDAKKIKDAGYDYVRLSHYPHSPAFMRACDELGLFVADAILGWQFFKNNDDFKNQMYKSATELVRRDRNHACVLAWEVSLNETRMPLDFMQKLHDIVHAEYPGPDAFTCGWQPDVYDIYFQARQHRIGHPEQMTFVKPYMVSEYGDWEYYSSNAGLNQHKLSRDKRFELSSRQLREYGEARLHNQAFNVQEAHNDNMNIPATGDSYWVMYDYNRGYHDDLESSGIMDIFRIAKPAYYFYQSQRSAKTPEDAMLHIATYWNDKSPTDVKVYSNCEQVELYLNGKLIAKQSPDKNKNTTNLNHPPFTFKVGKFQPGTLSAKGYINGKVVKESSVSTAGKAVALKVWLDESGVQAQSGCNDVLFLYVAAVDAKGNINYDYTDKIEVASNENFDVVNTDGIVTEAGIATALIKIGDNAGETTVSARSGELSGNFTFTIK